MKTKPILHLNLKRKWFDMISSGKKKEEYREIKPYWIKRFSRIGVLIKKQHHAISDIIICFSNGYSKTREQIFFECDFIMIGVGKEAWGAIPGKKYLILTLGKQVDKPENF